MAAFVNPCLTELDIKLSLRSKTANKDILDEIEACLTSDPRLLAHHAPEQHAGDNETDCYSHTELESLTSLSTSSCSSLSSSGEFEFDHQLSTLSVMVNQMSPFFSKLRDISNDLSKSSQDLNTGTQQPTSLMWPVASSPSESQRASSDVDSLVHQHTWSGVNSPVSSQSASPEMDGFARMSVASDSSSLCRDVFSPVNTHRVSVMSLSSAFSFLAEKGSLNEGVRIARWCFMCVELSCLL